MTTKACFTHTRGGGRGGGGGYQLDFVSLHLIPELSFVAILAGFLPRAALGRDNLPSASIKNPNTSSSQDPWTPPGPAGHLLPRWYRSNDSLAKPNLILRTARRPSPRRVTDVRQTWAPFIAGSGSCNVTLRTG